MTAITIKRILFATDFLENSRIALDYAVALAHHFHVSIAMLHTLVLPQPAIEAEVALHGPCMTREVALDKLNAFADGVQRTGLTVETFVEDGVPYKVVLDAVQRFQTDLLVLGVHGIHRGREHLLIGSNTERILLAATCPTLTVGPHVMSGVDLKLHLEKVLYFSDFTPEATAAAPYALMLGDAFGVPVDLCQLLPIAAEGNPRLREELAKEYCTTMKRVLNTEDSDWCIEDISITQLPQIPNCTRQLRVIVMPH
jgi:nucleotide-binding universal stress UspA family protein